METIKGIGKALQKWSASSVVFVMIATSVCTIDVYNAVMVGAPPALLRDLALMVFTFFYTNKSNGGA